MSTKDRAGSARPPGSRGAASAPARPGGGRAVVGAAPGAAIGEHSLFRFGRLAIPGLPDPRPDGAAAARLGSRAAHEPRDRLRPDRRSASPIPTLFRFPFLVLSGDRGVRAAARGRPRAPAPPHHLRRLPAHRLGRGTRGRRLRRVGAAAARADAAGRAARAHPRRARALEVVLRPARRARPHPRGALRRGRRARPAARRRLHAERSRGRARARRLRPLGARGRSPAATSSASRPFASASTSSCTRSASTTRPSRRTSTTSCARGGSAMNARRGSSAARRSTTGTSRSARARTSGGWASCCSWRSRRSPWRSRRCRSSRSASGAGGCCCCCARRACSPCLATALEPTIEQRQVVHVPNHVAVVVDTSRSMEVRPPDGGPSRAERARALLERAAPSSRPGSATGHHVDLYSFGESLAPATMTSLAARARGRRHAHRRGARRSARALRGPRSRRRRRRSRTASTRGASARGRSTRRRAPTSRRWARP